MENKQKFVVYHFLNIKKILKEFDNEDDAWNYVDSLVQKGVYGLYDLYIEEIHL